MPETRVENSDLDWVVWDLSELSFFLLLGRNVGVGGGESAR